MNNNNNERKNKKSERSTLDESQPTADEQSRVGELAVPKDHPEVPNSDRPRIAKAADRASHVTDTGPKQPDSNEPTNSAVNRNSEQDTTNENRERGAIELIKHVPNQRNVTESGRPGDVGGNAIVSGVGVTTVPVADIGALSSITTDLITMQMQFARATARATIIGVLSEYTGPKAVITRNKYSPFELVTGRAPRLVKLLVKYNPGQEPNVGSLTLGQSTIEATEQAKESLRVFNKSLMIARVVMEDDLLGMTLGDPSNPAPEVEIQMSQMFGSNISVANTATIFINRFIHAMKMVRKMENKIPLLQKKISVQPTPGPSFVDDLSKMSYSEGDYPHLYLIRAANLPPWLARDMDEAWRVAPADFNETAVQSRSGVKYSAIRNLAIDQYSSAMLMANGRRFEATQQNMDDFEALLSTNVLERSYVRVMRPPEGILNIMYSPPQYARRLTMLLIMADRSIRDAIIDEYTKIILGMGRFSKIDPTEIISPANGPKDAYSTSFNDAFLQIVSVGSTESFVRLIVLETLSAYVDVEILNKSLPIDAANSLSLLSIIAFMIFFPKLSNSMIHSLGYRITMILKRLVPSEMNAFIQMYGVNSQYDPDGQRWVAMQQQSELTRNQSQRGAAPSIFIAGERPVGVSNNFWARLRELQALVEPRIRRVRLEKKERARLPFDRDNYVGYASWPLTSIYDFSAGVESDITRNLRQATTLVNELMRLRVLRGTDRTTLTKVSAEFTSSLFTTMEFVTSSIGPLFTYSAAECQRLIMEGMGYCYERFNENRPWHAPFDIAMAPAVDTPNKHGLPFKPLKYSIDPNEAMMIWTQVSGDFRRNLSYRTADRAGIALSLPQPRTVIVQPDPGDLYRFWMGITMKAEDFGKMMQTIMWLRANPAVPNPAQQISEALRLIFRMSSWVPPVSYICALYGFSFEDLFTTAYSFQSGTVDGRDLTPRVAIVDPETMVPALERVIGTQYGREFVLTDETFSRLWDVATKLILTPQSPVVRSAIGVSIGRGMVAELSPYHPEALIEFPDRIPVDEVEFVSINQKGGMAIALRFDNLTFTSPYDPALGGRMILTRAFSQIPASHRQFVAAAISYGTLAVSASRVMVIYDYDDLSDRSVDYSEEMPMATINGFLSMTEGEVLTHRFRTTSYATNFSVNKFVVPGYVQWVYLHNSVDKDIFAAVFADSVDKPANAIFPPPQCLGLGRTDATGRSIMPLTGETKLDSRYVNFNNPVWAVTRLPELSVFKYEMVAGATTLNMDEMFRS